MKDLEKIDLALKFVEFSKKQERSQIDAKRYYYDANILLWRFNMAQIWNRHTDSSFLDLSRLEHAQATHEHTEQPTIQLGSVSFVDAIIRKYY